jgi:hypothetical protein
MSEMPQRGGQSPKLLALTFVLSACLAFSTWSLLQPRRPPAGIKSVPAAAPAKPRPSARPTESMEPELVCTRTTAPGGARSLA